MGTFPTYLLSNLRSLVQISHGGMWIRFGARIVKVSGYKSDALVRFGGKTTIQERECKFVVSMNGSGPTNKPLVR